MNQKSRAAAAALLDQPVDVNGPSAEGAGTAPISPAAAAHNVFLLRALGREPEDEADDAGLAGDE